MGGGVGAWQLWFLCLISATWNGHQGMRSVYLNFPPCLIQDGGLMNAVIALS